MSTDVLRKYERFYAKKIAYLDLSTVGKAINVEVLN